jgi:hypothetical protein
MLLTCWQITDGKNEDWLRDRWQAAKDMTGKPIDGNQWVMLDLGKRAQITRLVLGTLFYCSIATLVFLRAIVSVMSTTDAQQGLICKCLTLTASRA